MADGGILGIIQRRNPEREFEIMKQIGSGTYGEVYEAKVMKTGLKVALKIIKIEPGEDFNIIQQEIAILADCKHENIVGYSGSYLRRDRLWIAMEFCGGGSLQDIYHAMSGLNELQIAFVCREILQGLQYLHDRNKIHRDIKGANILLTNSGEVKLADFGIAAQLTQTLLMKRKSFIGTPYWMAPEVAAVERKGGYNQQCDIWAVGITAVELAETQPPMFDLHPMRALYLMTKRNFKSPGLQHKNKWSENFHEFLKYALQKEPRKRPSAQELLLHEFVNRNALCSALMLPLITVLEAPPPKSRTPVDDDTEDENPPDPENKRKNFKRIASVKNQAKIEKQLSEAEMKNLNLVPSSNQEMSWVEDPHYRPNIQKLETVSNDESSNNRVQSNNDDYADPDQQSPNSPPPYDQLPPVPPRTKDDSNDAVYGNVDQPAGGDQPPVPPRVAKTPVQTGPPLPPKQQQNPPRQQKKKKVLESDRRAYFSKIFNGCPLHLNCAASWLHPATKDQYVLLGAEEGLFSLHVIPNNPDPVMEQVSSRACHWLRVVENALIWLSGNSRFIATTNLTILFQTETQKQLQHSYGRNRQSVHTSKMQDSKNCSHCCVSRNPYSDQRYLIAVIPKGILLMQWYQPMNSFKLVQMFELSVPSPLNLLESFMNEGEEYPIVCFGVKESADGRLLFDTLNLNTHANWYTEEKPEGHDVGILCLQQLETNTFFIGIGRGAKFVDSKGVLKPSTVQASELTFDRKSEHMVYLSNCVLSFHKHGMQGKSLVTQQVTAEVADGSKVFHLLGSHGNIIIETRPLNDPASPTNIYILVSEDGATSQ